MWVFFNDGFVSVVQSNDDENCLVVRARRRQILSNLRDEMRDTPQITAGKKTDYRWRMVVRRDAWSQLMAERVMKIDYGNFKNSIPEGREGDDFHGFCSNVWAEGEQYQIHDVETTR